MAAIHNIFKLFSAKVLTASGPKSTGRLLDEGTVDACDLRRKAPTGDRLLGHNFYHACYYSI
jgi:hypothetical protein